LHHDAAAQLEPGNGGKIDIDDRNVRLQREIGMIAGLAVCRINHVDVDKMTKQGPAAGNDHGVIVDNENAHESVRLPVAKIV